MADGRLGTPQRLYKIEAWFCVEAESMEQAQTIAEDVLAVEQSQGGSWRVIETDDEFGTSDDE